jgi:hypothetical protein
MIDLGLLLMRVPGEIEYFDVMIQIIKRPVGADHILVKIPVIHDEEVSPQKESAQIVRLRSAKGKVDDLRPVIRVDPV